MTVDIKKLFNYWLSDAEESQKNIIYGFHPKQFDPKINPVAHEILEHGIKIV